MDISSKRILVTGADGFIGSHLVESLLEKGCNVRALCLYNSFNNRGWLEETTENEKLEIVFGDVRDPFLCNKITRDIDVIFHLAALIAIPYSYQAPASYVDTNVTGTLNMCQAALENGCKRFIQTSTSEVYGTARYVPIDEKHPLQPQSPYSASKIGADNMAMSYFYSFELPVTIARPFNTFGPRQSARAVIPTIITQIASGKKQIKLGDITTTRDFNFVKDTCGGFIALAESEKTIGEVVNIGSGKEISIKDTLEMIADIMGEKVEIITDSQRLRPENSEVLRLLCDNSKIHELTGFTPAFSLRQAMEKTIRWFTSDLNLSKYRPDVYNV